MKSWARFFLVRRVAAEPEGVDSRGQRGKVEIAFPPPRRRGAWKSDRCFPKMRRPLLCSRGMSAEGAEGTGENVAIEKPRRAPTTRSCGRAEPESSPPRRRDAKKIDKWFP